MKKLGLLALMLLLALGVTGSSIAYFSDMEAATAIFTAGEWELGGSPGFWKNWDKHNTYTESEMEGWLGTIESNSDWLVPDEDGDGNGIEDMEAVLHSAEGGSMEEKFLAQYLATRLNMEAGLLWSDGKHDITAIDKHNYLDVACPSSATLSEIVNAVEDKYTEEPEDKPTDKQFGILKDVCEALNELEI